MTQQPEALRLAETLDLLWLDGQTPKKAATELRRLHAELERLKQPEQEPVAREEGVSRLEAKIMQMQGRELKLQFALQAEKPAQQPLKSLTDLQIDAVLDTLDLLAPRAIAKAAITEFCRINGLTLAHGIKESKQ